MTTLKYILHCESDDVERADVRTHLEKELEGYEVVNAQSIFSARRQLKRVGSDLELVITNSPLWCRTTPERIVKELRNHDYQGPIIYTGDAPPENPELYAAFVLKTIPTDKESELYKLQKALYEAQAARGEQFSERLIAVSRELLDNP